MTDAVAIQLITTAGTVITVLVSGWLNRKTTRDKADEIHKKIDTMATTKTGEMFVLGKTPIGDASVNIPTERERRGP